MTIRRRLKNGRSLWQLKLPLASPDDAAEKRGSLVHTGDREQQWGSAYDESDDLDEEPER